MHSSRERVTDSSSFGSEVQVLARFVERAACVEEFGDPVSEVIQSVQPCFSPRPAPSASGSPRQNERPRSLCRRSPVRAFPRLLQLEIRLFCLLRSRVEISLVADNRKGLSRSRENPPFLGQLRRPFLQGLEPRLGFSQFPDLLCRSLSFVDFFLCVFLDGCQSGPERSASLPTPR